MESSHHDTLKNVWFVGERPNNYPDNGGQSFIAVLSETGVISAFLNSNIINTTVIKIF